LFEVLLEILMASTGWWFLQSCKTSLAASNTTGNKLEDIHPTDTNFV